MKKLVTLLFIVITNILFGQDSILIKKFDKLESLVNKQTSSTKDLRQEEKKLVERIDKLIMVYDSVSIQNMMKNEELENKISSNTSNIASINNKKPEKKQNSLTDWLKAIAALIAVVATIISVSNFYNQKIKRLNEIEEYFKVVIEALDEPLQQQSILLSNFSERIREKRLSNQVLGLIPEIKIDNAENIGHADLYKIFVNIRKGDRATKLKEFLRLQKALSFIKDYKNSMPKFYGEFNKKRNETHDFWNENIGEIGTFYDKFLIENSVITSPHIVNDSFMKRFRELNSNWQSLIDDENNINDPYIVLKHFIDLLYEFCQENTDPAKILELMPWIVNCKTAIMEFDNLKDTYSSFAKRDSQEIDLTRNHLKDTMNILLKIKKINKWNLLFS